MKTARVLILAACCLVAGCNIIGFFKKEGDPSNQQIYAWYSQTNLRQSTSTEVLSKFWIPEGAVLSQSKSIVALAGTTRQGNKTWLSMVTFDENELIAKRKYFLFYNEKPKELFVEPWEGADFGCQMILPKDVLGEPYANDNARRVAVLKRVESDTRKDMGEVGVDNAAISMCGMIAGQGMELLLNKLNDSPALAVRLSEPNGLEFEHTSFDKGRLRMVIDNDIVTVRMQLGAFAKRYEKFNYEYLKGMED